MIGNSRLEYCFIQLCIFGLHFIAPLCILYVFTVVALYGWKATRYPFPVLVEVGAVAETLFYFCFYIPYRRYLQKEAAHPEALSRDERRELFELCNDNIPDHEAYLRKWFLNANPEDIKRENVKEFFLWAFFNRDGPAGGDDEELEEYIAMTEEHLGRKIEEGRGKAKSLRLTIDPTTTMHRSLIWYWVSDSSHRKTPANAMQCVGFVDFLTFMNLLRHGFTFYGSSFKRFFTLIPLRFHALFTRRKSPAEHITYWHRPHTSKTKLPIVFIHGIGIGLYPYVNFLNELNSKAGIETSDDPDEQVGIIALEIMPVSFRLTHPALHKDAMCEEIAEILRYHKWDKVVLVSHSYGSVITTHLLKNEITNPMIGPVVLIDPVTILLHLPDVAYNFTRRKPQRANEWQLYYFASMDMGVSHTLSRHFFWSENVLWKRDLGDRPVTVSLAGQDLIVDTESVGDYMGHPEKSLTPTSSTRTSTSVERPIVDEEKDVLFKDDTENDDGEANGVKEWKTRPWKGTGTDVLWFENLDHAQVFDKASTRRPVIRAVRTYCRKSGGKAS